MDWAFFLYSHIIIDHVCLNANIPVFGDAELIVAMEEQDGKGRIIQGGIGSIDTPSVRDYAVQVLEGGREAFLMREKKYGIGEYNHFMNK